MTYVWRTKYVAMLAALIIGVVDIGAEPSLAAPSIGGSCETSCFDNVWISGDVLYLRASEDGFGCDFGLTNIATTVESGKVVTNIWERDREIDFNWNPGFRLGLGYDLEDDCWDTAVYWTSFYEKNKHRECNNRAHWKLRFNEVDAVLGYNLTYGQCFNIRPFFGARYANIQQTLSTHLETEILVLATNANSLAISKKRNRERFWGAGPLLGFDAGFKLGCGFSVYGNLAGTFLYGTFKNKFNDSDSFTAAISNCLAHSKNNSVLMGYDAGLGLRYELCSVTLQLGLEQHGYFDFNKIGCGGDLNLYGFNASAIFRF